jgi:hypothetical protein
MDSAHTTRSRDKLKSNAALKMLRSALSCRFGPWARKAVFGDSRPRFCIGAFGLSVVPLFPANTESITLNIAFV